ncbi:hypothetical protein B9Z19DRAFT_973514, partial [Tuber borchii]
DTEFGRTPLSWAADHGREGIVKMLLKRGDLNPNQADTKDGRTPVLWAAENGHRGVVNILLEREDVNLDQSDNKYGKASFRRSSENKDKHMVKMQFRGNNSITDTGREVGYDPKGPVSIPADSSPSTKPSIQSRLPSVQPLKSRFPLNTTSTHPSITQSIFSFNVDRRFTISSLICLFTFLLYILPSWPLNVSWLCKYLPGEGFM